MRSHTEWRIGSVVLAGFLLAAVPPAAARQTPPPPSTASPDMGEISRALEIVKADPNLATERTISTLRWKDSAEKKPSRKPGWLAWVGGLFGWLARSARVLMWCVAIVLAGMLAVFIVRVVRNHATTGGEAAFVAPTHVRDLDIRPETLPHDIGAAARALWDRGEHRAALALLYRGLLSRLAHVHRVPIRDSTTEGDCLTLAERHLTPRRREYASRVIRVWQRAVYGREEVPASTVHVLCEDFGPMLGRGSQPEGAISGGAA